MKDKDNPNKKRSFRDRRKKGKDPEVINEREISPEDLAKLIEQSSDQEDHLQDIDFIMPQKKPEEVLEQIGQMRSQKKDESHSHNTVTKNTEESVTIKETKDGTELEVKEQSEKSVEEKPEHFSHEPEEELEEQAIEDMPININDPELFNEDLIKAVRKEKEKEKRERRERKNAEQSVQEIIVENPEQSGAAEKNSEKSVKGEDENKPVHVHTEPEDQSEHDSHSKQDEEKQSNPQDTETEPLIEELVEEDAHDLLHNFENEVRKVKKNSKKHSDHAEVEPESADQQTSAAEKKEEKAEEDHSKANKPKSPVHRKAEKFLSQWQIYLILGAIVSLLVLLWKIHSLHFFKLSFAGLILGLGGIAIVLAVFCFFYTRRKFWSIPAVLLCVLVVLQSIGLQKQMGMISTSLENMSSTSQAYGRSMGIYVPAMIPISGIEALDGETIGIMSQRDDEGIHAVLEDLDSKGIHVKTRSYTSLQQLYKGVRGLAVRAVILNAGDVHLIQDFSGSQNQASQLSLTYSVNLSNTIKNERNGINLEQDSYTILISGSNDPLTETSYRSNFNVVLTINPKTKEILTVVLPRTLAISSTCQDELACLPSDEQDRLSLVSYHSIEALRQTVEAYLGTPIDFTVRVDTDKILQLFDLDHSIHYQDAKEVDSFSTIQNGTGKYLNGPQIKQLLGSTNDLAPEDFEQELTLLRVLNTLLHSQALPNTKDLNPVLDILKQSISTSMNTTQLSQLIKMFFIFPQKMNETYTLLGSTSNTQFSPTLTETVYMSTVDPASLQKVQTAMQAVLNGEPYEVEPLPTPSLFDAIEQAGQQQTPEPQPQDSEQAVTTEQAQIQNEQTEPQPTPEIPQVPETPAGDEEITDPNTGGDDPDEEYIPDDQTDYQQ